MVAGADAGSRSFIYHPASEGTYDVQVRCGGVFISTCGRVFFSNPSPPITMAFGGDVPSDKGKFKDDFGRATAEAAQLNRDQVLVGDITPTRRRAGFTITFQVIQASATTSIAQIQAAIVAAANSPAFATALANAGIQNQPLALIITPGATPVVPAAAQTTAPGGSPAPAPITTNAADKRSSSSLISLALGAALALISLVVC